MRRFSRNIRTTKWTDIYETTLAPWLLPTVLMAGIGKMETIFRVTDKSSTKESNSAFRYTCPYLAGIALCVVGIIRLVGLSGREQTYTYCVILFWLFLNLYFMVMALYVTAGRKIKTDYQLQKIEAEAIVAYKPGKYTVQCKAFSDNFISLEFPGDKASNINREKGILFLKETEITLPLKNGVLKSYGDVQRCLYEIDWMSVDDDTRYCYMEFLYNRTPVLPQELKRNTILDECITALLSRLINE